MGRGLEDDNAAARGKSDLATRIYLLGAIFSISKENRLAMEENRGLRNIISDLHSRLEDNFTLNNDQNVCPC